MLPKAFHTHLLKRNLRLKYVKPFVDNIANYGTQSVKSGAASNPACRSISADLLDMIAGWKCAISKNRYIKHTAINCLKVARYIALLVSVFVCLR